jgi:hypothetical protein
MTRCADPGSVSDVKRLVKQALASVMVCGSADRGGQSDGERDTLDSGCHAEPLPVEVLLRCMYCRSNTRASAS